MNAALVINVKSNTRAYKSYLFSIAEYYFLFNTYNIEDKKFEILKFYN